MADNKDRRRVLELIAESAPFAGGGSAEEPPPFGEEKVQRILDRVRARLSADDPLQGESAAATGAAGTEGPGASGGVREPSRPASPARRIWGGGGGASLSPRPKSFRR